MRIPPHSPRLRRAARRYFGWRSLRPNQLAAMRALLRHQDALVVLPTGAGKSAVYQVPATLLAGPTVVVSPLLALQHDQIAALNDRRTGHLRAVRISSAETPRQQEEALADLRAGRARFLFITPEQLGRPDRLTEIRALRPALIAIDEAHCVSAWGYDFRPDYLALGHAIEALGRPPVVALTATASPPVRDDIIDRLGLRTPRVVVAGLDRPNLFLEAANCPDEDYRWRRLAALLDEVSGPGIVYAPTRRAAESLSERLTEAGLLAQAYHGGMAAGARHERHRAFLDDQVQITVATSAFGMGIDKPNIRFVAHTALPDSPDSYLQEIGRAGRDGEPARTLLLFRAEDMALRRYFTGAPPDLDQLRDLAATLRTGLVRRTALRERTGLGARRLGQLVALLEQVGAVTIRGDHRLSVPRYAPAPDQAARAALAEAERQQALRRSRTDMMRAYAETPSCRGQVLLTYFGDHLPRPCGHCDNCATGAAATFSAGAATGPYPLNSTVRHTEWGAGLVMGYDEDRVTVLFEDRGYKTLSVPVVEEQGLLVAEPA